MPPPPKKKDLHANHKIYVITDIMFIINLILSQNIAHPCGNHNYVNESKGVD